MIKGKKVLWLLAAIYVVLIAVYIILHSCCIEGSRLERISADDVKIIRDSIESLKSRMDKDIAAIKADFLDVAAKKDTIALKKHKEDSIRAHYRELALKQIDIYLPEKYKNDFIGKVWIINASIKDKSLMEISAIAPDITIPLRSYFWFGNEFKYFEVIFWSLFGVLCSLLFVCSEGLRNGKFNENEEFIYWAKLFYTPAIALIIIWGYKQFVMPQTAGSKIEIDESSYGLLVASFIIGFFSRRGIDLLTKIKDVIMPSGQDGDILGSILGTAIPPYPGADPKYLKLLLMNEDGSIAREDIPVDNNFKFSITGLKAGKYKIKAEYEDKQIKAAGVAQGIAAAKFESEESIELGKEEQEVMIKLSPVNIQVNLTGIVRAVDNESLTEPKDLMAILEKDDGTIVRNEIQLDDDYKFSIPVDKPGGYRVKVIRSYKLPGTSKTIYIPINFGRDTFELKGDDADISLELPVKDIFKPGTEGNE